MCLTQRVACTGCTPAPWSLGNVVSRIHRRARAWMETDSVSILGSSTGIVHAVLDLISRPVFCLLSSLLANALVYLCPCP